MKKEFIISYSGNNYWDFLIASDNLNALARKLHYDVWFDVVGYPSRGYVIEVEYNDSTQLALFNMQTGTIPK